MRPFLISLVLAFAALAARSEDGLMGEYGSASPSPNAWLVQSFRVAVQLEAPRATGQYLDATLEVLNQPLPEFPAVCINAGVYGEATVSFLIRPDGHLEQIAIVSRTHQEFADSAIKAVRQWCFKPITFQGQPTSLPVQAHFAFSIFASEQANRGTQR
jgi:TonB family protein